MIVWPLVALSVLPLAAAHRQGRADRVPMGLAHAWIRQERARGIAVTDAPAVEKTRAAPARRRDPDPARRQGRQGESPARQAPSRPQVHARQIRLSRRAGRSLRPSHECRRRARRACRGAADEAATRRRGQSRFRPRPGAGRDPRNVRGNRPGDRHSGVRRPGRRRRAAGPTMRRALACPICRTCISSLAPSPRRTGQNASTPAFSPWTRAIRQKAGRFRPCRRGTGRTDLDRPEGGVETSTCRRSPFACWRNYGRGSTGA